MSGRPEHTVTPEAKAMTNGFGAAAIFAASFGALLIAVLAIAADKSTTIKSWMNFYHPTGPLSGVTTTAILAWAICWIVLALRWHDRNVAMTRVSRIAITLLVLSLLLTFPPIADLF